MKQKKPNKLTKVYLCMNEDHIFTTGEKTSTSRRTAGLFILIMLLLLSVLGKGVKKGVGSVCEMYDFEAFSINRGIRERGAEWQY